MKKRKLLSSAVELRPSLNFESEMLVERDRLFILFVHVDSCSAKLLYRVPDQAPPNTHPMP